MQDSLISRQTAIPLEVVFTNQPKGYLFIAYQEFVNIWRLATIYIWNTEKQPYLPRDYDYAKEVLFLGNDCFPAIAVDVTYYLYADGLGEKTLYLPIALLEDLTPENANHKKIEKVVMEFYGTSERIKTIDRIHFYGDSCELWAVHQHSVRPWC